MKKKNDRSVSNDSAAIIRLAHRNPPTTFGQMKLLGHAAAAYAGDPLLAIIPETPASPEQWHAYASWIARFASEALHPIRLDVVVDDELGVVAYYDNNPVRARDQAHEVLRALLAVMNVEILASASYPERGDEAEYTTALVLRGVEDVDRIRLAVSACLAGQGLGGHLGGELP